MLEVRGGPAREEKLPGHVGVVTKGRCAARGAIGKEGVVGMAKKAKTVKSAPKTGKTIDKLKKVPGKIGVAEKLAASVEGQKMGKSSPDFKAYGVALKKGKKKGEEV